MLLKTFGGGNDLVRWFFSDYMYCSLYLFNYINRLVMNDWDKVEKRKRAATEQDIFFEHLKTACFVVIGLVYLYFLFIHNEL